jgi:cytidylate kinase
MAHGIHEIVERQMRFWRVQGGSSRTAPHCPCVALSRLPHSGAAEIGHKLAERLGYGFFGIEIVDQIAREQGVARQLVEGLDEHVRNVIERYAVDALRGRASITEVEYLNSLVRVIATLGERGGAVILGRGASFILPPTLALRVFLVAPREARLARLARVRKRGEEEARRMLEAEDADRLTFLRYYFEHNPDDAVFYDLSVNTESFPSEEAVELILEALVRRFPGCAAAASRSAASSTGRAARIE